MKVTFDHELVELAKEFKSTVFTKSNIPVLLFTVIAFTMVSALFVHQYRIEYREAVRYHLMGNIWFLPSDFLEEMMTQYKLSFDDISPLQLFEGAR